MKLKDLLEAPLNKMVHVFRMTDEDRKELKELISKDLNMEEFDKQFMELCVDLDKHNRYIKHEDSATIPGTIDEIIHAVKKKTSDAASLPTMKVGDLVKVGGVAYVKLDDGSLVDLHHKK